MTHIVATFSVEWKKKRWALHDLFGVKRSQYMVFTTFNNRKLWIEADSPHWSDGKLDSADVLTMIVKDTKSGRRHLKEAEKFIGTGTKGLKDRYWKNFTRVSKVSWIKSKGHLFPSSYEVDLYWKMT